MHLGRTRGGWRWGRRRREKVRNMAGAVMRYGPKDWNLVANELRARTDCPYALTPEVCQDKYEDLHNRHSGCKTWRFEELRKKRMKELKQALKQSENSIGSLESKLESLKAENVEGGCINNHGSDQTESPVHSHKSEGTRHYSFGKEICKDESSAGSFTCEAFTHCSPERQVVRATREASHSSEHKKFSIGDFYCGLGGTLRKRRGKRKRKGCDKNRFLDSNRECHGNLGSCGAGNLCKDGANYLCNVFSSISEHKSASVFRHRLDSQKRRRYKKLVRRHMDFDTIGSRIASHSLVSVKELFRDILLLANNALVFYSKSTREYKSALLLRDLTTKTLRRNLKVYWSKAATNTPVCNTPVKPRSTVRPSNQKLRGKAIDAGKSATKASKQSKEADANANANGTGPSPSVNSSAMTKKVSSHRKKAGRKTLGQQNVVPLKARKKSRTTK